MNILLTSAGRRSYLVEYFRRALIGKGLVHAGNSTMSTALLAADMRIITPLIYDKDYIRFLIDYCKKYNISAIIPLFDVDLPILAKAKQMFRKQEIEVVISRYEVVKICNDKWRTYNFLRKNQIPTPKTYINFDYVQKKIDKKIINFPLIIKPRWGMGSIGIYKVENTNELEVLYNKSVNDIKKSYLKFESKENMEKCIIIQEYLEGIEYGLDVVNDLEEKYTTTFVKRKLAMRSGETDAAITEYNPTLEKIGFTLSSNLCHIGVLDVDCVLCGQKPYVLEMNARFGGHYPFSHLAGANIPEAIIKWLNHEVPNQNVFKIDDGVIGIKNIVPIKYDQP